jgi:hypothetical protein
MTESSSPSQAEPDGSTETPERTEGPTAIRVLVGDTVLDATLEDNATARSLLDQLPLTVPVADFGRQEKIATPPRPLSMEGMPAGDDPEPGDIGYYAPDGVLVFYYADVGYFDGIARLGRFETPLDDLVDVPDGTPVTVEIAP